MTTIPEYPDIIRKKTKIEPTNVFEIGAANGMDANFIRESFNIPPQNVYCFEAHPGNYNSILNNYPEFKCFNIAISDINGESTFQLHGPSADISSFRKRTKGIGVYPYPGTIETNYSTITINTLRMDSFIDQHKITQIDVCKIDVEGCSHEVLSGFGDKLSLVKIMHIEAELVEMFEKEHLYKEVEQLLLNSGFVIVDYHRIQDGLMCDTIWVRKDMVK